MIVEALFKNRRVASHARSFQKGKYTTLPEHLPPAHQHHLAWTPERILRWTEKIGPCTAAVAQEILKAKDYPEQGFRACLGLIRLGNRFSHARLEAACQRASRMKHYRYQSIKSILTSGLDQQPLTTIPEPPIRLHPHIRGKDYYQ
jgi:transposase